MDISPIQEKLLHFGYFKEEHMSELKDYEKDLLKSYLKLPVTKLLNHEFEIEEAQLAGYVQRFLKGERYSYDFIPYSEKELDVITKLIDTQIQTYDGKDLLTSFLLTKIVCNIMNKYKNG